MRQDSTAARGYSLSRGHGGGLHPRHRTPRTPMRWHVSHRFDPRALPLADRHYNRQTIGSPQFVPPGRCAVFLTRDASALWVTSWPFAAYVRHRWPGAWVCSAFRNEGEHLSSELIREAVAATVATFAPPPTCFDVGRRQAGTARHVDRAHRGRDGLIRGPGQDEAQARPRTLLPAGRVARPRGNEGWTRDVRVAHGGPTGGQPRERRADGLVVTPHP